MTQAERPLSDEERHQLTARLANARAETRRALLKTGFASGAVCTVLGILTLLASDAPALFVVVFWAVLWLIFTFWIGIPWRSLMRDQVRMLAKAVRTNRVREIRVQAMRVVEFEEEEDEGACYAFACDDSTVLFIVGQEFYEDNDFPNSDFSMVEILGERGEPIDVVLNKRGQKLQPERIIPAATKNGLTLPDHLSIVSSTLDRLEATLRRNTP